MNGSSAGAASSKRDKRRSALQERLADLTASFSQNRDAHFRQQLHALQCDMTLLNNADPYDPGPLPDDADEIAALIENTVGGGKFAREMAGLAGMWYSRFVQEVNQAKEDRDTDLTMLMHRHNDNLDRFNREYRFRVHFASEEYNKLSGTLRERLVSSINGKKTRLMREKEHLDIADTNALLLHPNQFSITNPASPGGLHGNRKTRHTRHRIDLDELGNGVSDAFGGGNAAGGGGTNKRKRKADDDHPPASPARDAPTPADRAKVKEVQQQNAAAYSIHSLFTDKELTLHANYAHVATTHFFSVSRRAEHAASGLATNGHNTDVDEASGFDGTGAEDNGTPAESMARTASHQNFHHATRSTRTQAHAALSTLADLSDKPATRPNLPYHILANYHARPNGNAPPLPSLMNDEIEDDLARIDRLLGQPASFIDRTLIDECIEVPHDDVGEGVVPPQDPARFNFLHPDFPADMGVRWFPMRNAGEREAVEMVTITKTTATAEIPRGPVEADLVFYVPPEDGSRPFNYVEEPPTGLPQRNFGETTHKVTIEDIRGDEHAYDLDTDALQALQGVPTQTTYATFDSDEEVQRVYYPEVEKLLFDHVQGVHKVIIFDHTIRRQESKARRQPVNRTHVDQTAKAAADRVRLHVSDPEEAEKLLRGRYRIINVWRPLNGAVVSAPLAFASAASVDRENDLVAVEHRYPDRTGETMQVKYNPALKWKYWSGMENDERLLLKCSDTAEGVGTSVPHTAFVDPRTPVGGKPRESIEVRTLVFG
ncbi:hypothetical protein ASPZODRAFT_153782 [Penicilliopsis zonata CBS 506.65]|uniref:Uncharacterized protein n=1 Tax=Penicilliopsis zonata CBS 506.65 TaxID=1073090 RepID=A0A1L9SAY9_9EURO|nr:hypothetical protein ASPZODRAFT_153782 [Penicilliopsis zonata CBS 506.65]OJJ44318.1 hypothetical protein ASPZODRAFT_153782 [Penicilliopsis zonata CBS 506.65]